MSSTQTDSTFSTMFASYDISTAGIDDHYNDAIHPLQQEQQQPAHNDLVQPNPYQDLSGMMQTLSITQCNSVTYCN